MNSIALRRPTGVAHAWQMTSPLHTLADQHVSQNCGKRGKNANTSFVMQCFSVPVREI